MAVESWSVLFSYIACVFFFIQFSKSFLRLKNNSFKFPVARLLSFSSLVHDFDALISYFSLTISATGRERRWKCCTRTKPTRTVRIQRQRKWGVKIQSVNCDEWRATERTNERENRVSDRFAEWNGANVRYPGMLRDDWDKFLACLYFLSLKTWIWSTSSKLKQNVWCSELCPI